MKQVGFTLFELMVVIAIMAILTVLAYPSVVNYLHGSESRQVRSILSAANHQARLESYVNKQNVILCLATIDDVCHKTAHDKVLVFYDRDNNQQLDHGELISSHILNLKYGTVEMRVSAARHYMKYFGGTGTPKGHFGHIKYCSTSAQKWGHRTVVTLQGGISVREGC